MRNIIEVTLVISAVLLGFSIHSHAQSNRGSVTDFTLGIIIQPHPSQHSPSEPNPQTQNTRNQERTANTSDLLEFNEVQRSRAISNPTEVADTDPKGTPVSQDIENSQTSIEEEPSSEDGNQENETHSFSMDEEIDQEMDEEIDEEIDAVTRPDPSINDTIQNNESSEQALESVASDEGSEKNSTEPASQPLDRSKSIQPIIDLFLGYLDAPEKIHLKDLDPNILDDFKEDQTIFQNLFNRRSERNTLLDESNVDGWVSIEFPSELFMTIRFYSVLNENETQVETFQIPAVLDKDIQKRLEHFAYQITATFLECSITITTPMPNVEVYYNNEFLGRTPLSLKAHVGEYPLLLVGEGTVKLETTLYITPYESVYPIAFGESSNRVFAHQLLVQIQVIDFLRPNSDGYRPGFGLSYFYSIYENPLLRLQVGIALDIFLVTYAFTAAYYTSTFNTEKEVTVIPITLQTKAVFGNWKIPVYPYLLLGGGVANHSVTHDHYQHFNPFFRVGGGVQAHVKRFMMFAELRYQDFNRIRILKLQELMPHGNHTYIENQMAILGFSLHAGVGVLF